MEGLEFDLRCRLLSVLGLLHPRGRTSATRTKHAQQENLTRFSVFLRTFSEKKDAKQWNTTNRRPLSFVQSALARIPAVDRLEWWTSVHNHFPGGNTVIQDHGRAFRTHHYRGECTANERTFDGEQQRWRSSKKHKFRNVGVAPGGLGCEPRDDVAFLL